MTVPDTDPGSILAFRDRQIAVELVAAALLHLDLFTWLSERGGGTATDICEHYGFAERPVDVLLTLCRAYQYLEIDAEGVNRVTTKASEHLTVGSPWYLGPYYQPMKESPFVLDYLEVLKTGKPANWRSDDEGADWHESMLDETFAREFTSLMDCRGLAFGQKLAREIEPVVSGHRRILDVGGGSGVYAEAIVTANPHLTGVVLEQAPVDQIARKIISERGLSEKIQVVEGDMFNDPWPVDCDIHLLSNLLHDWDFPEIKRIIARSAESIPAGGLLVIHQAFLNDDKNGPIEVAEYSTLLMHMTQGRCYSRAELDPILREAGFQANGSGDTFASRGYLTAMRCS